MLLEDALNGIQSKEKYMPGSQILSAKYDKGYNTTIPPPHILSSIDKAGKYHTPNNQNVGNYGQIPKSTPNGDSGIDDVLKQYEDFKQESEGLMRRHKDLANDQSLRDDRPQRPEPIQIPPLRDPSIRNPNQPMAPNEEQKVPVMPSQGVQNILNNEGPESQSQNPRSKQLIFII